MKSKLFILLVLVVFLSTSFSVGCEGMTYPRDDFQVVCRDTDAIVLRSSGFDSKGKIYYLKKNGSRWELAQTIDISRYLGVRDVRRPYHSARNWGRLALKSFTYDDQWLGVILTQRVAWFEDIRVEVPGVKPACLLFKKVDGQWTFYDLFSPRSYTFSRKHLELSHDSLIVADYHSKGDSDRGRVCCFDLTGRKPVLKQEILPPYDANLESDPYTVLAHGCQMIIEWTRPISEEDKAEMANVAEMKSPVPDDTSDVVLYRWDGEKWAFEQNLSDCLPRELYLKKRGQVLGALLKVDWTEDQLYCYEGLGFGVYKFTKLESGDWIFDGSLKRGETDVKRCAGELGYQTPEIYNVLWRDKIRRIGVVKPSADGEMRITEPDWLFEDSDPETSRKMCSYYKSINNYHGRPTGSRSYYDFTDYIPTIDYFQQTLATTLRV